MRLVLAMMRHETFFTAADTLAFIRTKIRSIGR